MSIFQRRHYQKCANILEELYYYRDWEPDCWTDLIESIMDMFHDDNKKFDYEIFLKYMEMTRDEETGFIRPTKWNGADYV